MKLKFSLESKILLIVSSGLFLSGLLIGVYYFHSEQSQLERLLLKQSRSLFNQIQITRHWNAEHGGIYVLLEEGEQPNPYLYKVAPRTGAKADIEPELIDQKGRRLGLINPAMMTRQLSVESASHSDISFHLTSLQLINPNNKPDDFEKASLIAFEKGVLEKTQYTDKKGLPYFRYMAPLKTRKDCLRCHGFQGYQIDDIRGGISVSIPIEEELSFSYRKRGEIFSFVIVISFSTILLLVFAIRRLVRNPLNDLTKMGENIGDGKLAVPYSLDENDEMGKLGNVLLESDRSLHNRKAKLESYAKDMTKKALHDPLTALPNRLLFFDSLTDTLKQARQFSFGVAVLFIDLDRFKLINDELGHERGDELLVEVASRLKSCVRRHDIVARIGGDEFSIVLSHIDSQNDAWMTVTQKIIAELSRAFILNGNEYFIGCSVGISEFPDDGKTPAELLRKADEAMYAVKNSGRNNFIHYSSKWSEVMSMSNSEIDHEHLHMLDLLNAVSNEIEAHEFDKEEVLQILKQLYVDTVEHFTHEELLFVECNYPDAENHAQIHQQNMQKLNKSMCDIEQEDTTRQQCAEICFAIKDLLISHVLKDDIKYIQYLREN